MPEDTGTTTETGTAAETAAVTPDEIVGLKSALEKERAAAKEGRAASKRLGELEAELSKVRESQQSEAEKSIAQAKTEAAKEARDEVLSKVTESLVRANVRVAAAGRLADPDDAIKMLDLSEFELDDTFSLDMDKVKTAIDELLKAKPYLGGEAPAKKERNSGFDLGARNPVTVDTNDPRSLIAAGLAESTK